MFSGILDFVDTYKIPSSSLFFLRPATILHYTLTMVMILNNLSPIYNIIDRQRLYFFPNIFHSNFFFFLIDRDEKLVKWMLWIISFLNLVSLSRVFYRGSSYFQAANVVWKTRGNASGVSRGSFCLISFTTVGTRVFVGALWCKFLSRAIYPPRLSPIHCITGGWSSWQRPRGFQVFNCFCFNGQLANSRDIKVIWY